MNSNVDGSHPATIIEFIGLPGSGKTYLANQICDLQAYTRVNFSKRSAGPIRSFFRYSFILISASIGIIGTLARSGFFHQRDKHGVKVWQIKLLMRLHILADRNRARMKPNLESPLVLDQGVMQSMVSCRMAGLAISENYATKLLTKAGISPINRLVVLHGASAETSLQSAQNRAGNKLPVLDRFKNEDLREKFDHYLSAIGWMSNLLERNCYTIVRTYRQDATGLNIERILSALPV